MVDYRSTNVEGEGASASGGRDAFAAGRDLHFHAAPQSSPDPSGALRAVKDEIAHIQRRFRQFEEQREEWGSIWPMRETGPYRILPADAWHAHKGTLGLGDSAHEIVTEAYEQANDFNNQMLAGPTAFGDPEPKLDELKVAFAEAATALEPSAPIRGRRIGVHNRGDMELEDSSFGKTLDTGIKNDPDAKFRGKRVDFE